MGQIIRPRTFTPKTLTVNDHTVGVKNNVISALGRENDDLSQKISLAPSLTSAVPQRLSNAVTPTVPPSGTPTADPTADPDAPQQKADFLATNGIDSEGIKEKETNTAQKTKDSVLAEAQAEYDRSRATYGVQAQSLRDSGLNRSGYAAYVDRLVAEQKNAVNAQAQDDYIAAMQNAEENYLANEKTNQKLYNQWLESLGEKTTTYAVSNALTDEEALIKYALSLGATQAQAEEFAASAAVAAKPAADQQKSQVINQAITFVMDAITKDPTISNDQLAPILFNMYPGLTSIDLATIVKSARASMSGYIKNWMNNQKTTESNQSTERKRTAIDSVLTYLAYNENLTDTQLSNILENTIPGITGEEIAAAISTARGLYVEEESTGITVTENYAATSADYASFVETLGHDATIDYMRNSGEYDERDLTALENRYNALQDVIDKAEEEQHASLMETLPAVITAISEGDVDTLYELNGKLKTILPAETLAAYNAAQGEDEEILVIFNYAQSLYYSDKSAENAALLNAVGDARVKDLLTTYSGTSLIKALEHVLDGDFATKEHINDQLAIIGETISITNDNEMNYSCFDLNINGEALTIAVSIAEQLTEAPKEKLAQIGSLHNGTKEYYINQNGSIYIKSVTEDGESWTRIDNETSKRDGLKDDEFELARKALVAYHFAEKQESSSSLNSSRYAAQRIIQQNTAIKSPEELDPIEMAELEALYNTPAPLSQKGYQQKVEEIVKKDNHQTSWLTTNTISETANNQRKRAYLNSK